MFEVTSLRPEPLATPSLPYARTRGSRRRFFAVSTRKSAASPGTTPSCSMASCCRSTSSGRRCAGLRVLVRRPRRSAFCLVGPRCLGWFAGELLCCLQAPHSEPPLSWARLYASSPARWRAVTGPPRLPRPLHSFKGWIVDEGRVAWGVPPFPHAPEAGPTPPPSA